MKTILKLLIIFLSCFFTHKISCVFQNMKTFTGDAKIYFMQSHKLGHSLINTNIFKKSLHEIKLLRKNKQYNLHAVNYNSVLFKLFWQKLTTLPEHLAVKIWVFISLFTHILGIFFIIQAFRINVFYLILPSIIYILFSPTTLAYIKSGQVSGITTLIVGVLCHLYCNHKSKYFATFLGFAIYFKYFFAGITPILIKKNKLTLITILSFSLLFIVPNFFVYKSHTIEHFSFFTTEISIITILFKNLNFISSGLLSMLVRPWIADFGPQELAIWKILLLYLLSTLLLYYKCLPHLNIFKQDKTHLEKIKTISILLTLSNIASPLSWAYYYALYLPSILLILYTIQNRKNKPLYMFAILIIIIIKSHMHSNFNLQPFLLKSSDMFVYSLISLKNFWVSYNGIFANFGILYLTITSPIKKSVTQLQPSTMLFYIIVTFTPWHLLKYIKLTALT